MARSVARVLVLSSVLWASACGDPEIIVPDIMTLVAILPGHGTVDVSEEVEPLVYLSHEAADGAEVERSIALDCLGGPTAGSCAEPDSTACVGDVGFEVVYEASTQVAKLTPNEPLQSDTCYVIIVSEGIHAAATNVGPLPVEVRSSFKTR